jgi:hypothetical protein
MLMSSWNKLENKNDDGEGMMVMCLFRKRGLII